jgi:mycothiol synthase
MKIRQATPADYSSLADLINCLYPDRPTSPADIAEDDKQRDQKFKFQRWVAVEKKRIIGSGNYSQSIWFAHPQKFRVWIGVLPEHQKRGIGSLLFDTIIQGLQPFDPIALRTSTTEDRSDSIRFLAKRGFKEVIRDIPSELDLKSFDLSRFTGIENRFEANGILIKTLPELENDPERNQKLYDLDWELSLSVPGDLAAGMGPRGLDKYIEYAISGPNALPDCFFVAKKGDEYIGLSHLLSVEKGITLYQGLTGVKPQYRRLGVGMAMKIRGITFAKGNGYSVIRAENDAKNIPMLAMNERLGYIRKTDVITFEKQLPSPENIFPS